MDFNDALFWLVSLSVALLAARVAVQRPFPWGWLFVLLLIAGTIAVGYVAFPGIIGYVALAEWLLLVLIPSLGQRLALRLVNARRTTSARWVARIVAALHPADGWRETRTFVDALAALQEGRFSEGEKLLARLQDRRSSLGRTALALRARQSADWEGFLAWINHAPDRDSLVADASLLDVYLQALGETGRRNLMLHEFSDRLDGLSHPTAQLRVAALCGDVATVESLLSGPLQSWPQDVQRFWLATARQVDDTEAARTDFEDLTQSSNGLVAAMSRRRLIQPLPPVAPDELSEHAQSILHSLRHDAAHEARFAVMSSTPYRRPVVTLLIALLLAINFAREFVGGAEDQQNLIDLGAIVIPRVPGFDEWWRPLTAAFLHFGWAHFLMNFFALLYLGTRLERAWGSWKTLLCYAASIAVSMTATPWLLEQSLDQPQMLAGASGGIMGLLGGLLGHLMIGRLRRRTPQVARQLSLLIGFVLLQTIFDLSHEAVSHQAHLLGLATGTVVGLIVGATSRVSALDEQTPVSSGPAAESVIAT